MKALAYGAFHSKSQVVLSQLTFPTYDLQAFQCTTPNVNRKHGRRDYGVSVASAWTIKLSTGPPPSTYMSETEKEKRRIM